MKDITGQKFGHLTAIRPTDERKGTSVVWECECDCGNKAYVSTHYLTTGKTRSCGCLKRGRKTEDITGQKFGRLTAIRPTNERKSGHVIWECECDCGNVAYVQVAHLKSGNTRSCGCLSKRVVRCIETGEEFSSLHEASKKLTNPYLLF